MFDSMVDATLGSKRHRSFRRGFCDCAALACVGRYEADVEGGACPVEKGIFTGFWRCRSGYFEVEAEVEIEVAMVTTLPPTLPVPVVIPVLSFFLSSSTCSSCISPPLPPLPPPAPLAVNPSTLPISSYPYDTRHGGPRHDSSSLLSLALSVLEKLRKARPQFLQIGNLILTRLLDRRLIVRLDEVCGRPAKVCGCAAVEVGIIWWCVSFRSIVFLTLEEARWEKAGREEDVKTG